MKVNLPNGTALDLTQAQKDELIKQLQTPERKVRGIVYKKDFSGSITQWFWFYENETPELSPLSHTPDYFGVYDMTKKSDYEQVIKSFWLGGSDIVGMELTKIAPVSGKELNR